MKTIKKIGQCKKNDSTNGNFRKGKGENPKIEKRSKNHPGGEGG